MNENLKKLTEDFYKVFSKYPVSYPLDICTVCCASKDEEKRLINTPVRKLSKELIWVYSAAAKPNKPNLKEWKHFLPRYIELASGFKLPHDIPELSISLNKYYEEEDWEKEEWELIQTWGLNYFETCLKTYPLPQTEYIDTFITMLYLGKVKIEKLLTNWENNLSLYSVLHFSDLINHGYNNFVFEKLANAFSDEILSQLILCWIQSENTRTIFSEAILKVIEQGNFDDVKHLELECTFNVLNS